ncbi:Abi family protein [Phytoactinopolyspora endophytica]|uniref:Abi family protein n=1 Tax=Phytoactinopolyspora endophytica TaxID=1642495 RepID=UPI00101D1374|nr:Abi family protein [Phytoactinopolyspora endophytica]
MTVLPNARSIAPVLYRCLSPRRLHGYLASCQGEAIDAIALYEWNSQISGAMWESLGHVEVALRNSVADQLELRHGRLSRDGSWLDDPAQELEAKRRNDIARARERIWRNNKEPSDGQTISELPFGFWRFLLAKRYATTLWPDLADGFPYAPGRSRTTIEQPVQQLHRLRNGIAHRQRIWTEPLNDRWDDICELLGYIDPALRRWVIFNSRVPSVMSTWPTVNPNREDTELFTMP